jgi:hypothetical protein
MEGSPVPGSLEPEPSSGSLGRVAIVPLAISKEFPKPTLCRKRGMLTGNVIYFGKTHDSH